VELAFLDIQKYIASFMNPFPWCDELTTIFSSFSSSFCPPLSRAVWLGRGSRSWELKVNLFLLKEHLQIIAVTRFLSPFNSV